MLRFYWILYIQSILIQVLVENSKKYQEVIKYIKDKEIKYWSIDDVNFIKKNYNIIGGKKCAEILGKNLNSVYNKIRLLKTKKEI